MADKYKISTGIRKIDLVDEDDELICTLRINTADPMIPKRFKDLYDKVKTKGDAYRKQSGALAKRVQGSSFDDMEPLFKVRIDFCKGLEADVDAVFGPGTVQAATAKQREINPDYIPDELWYTDFITQIMPIMNELFASHFEQAKDKYGV